MSEISRRRDGLAESERRSALARSDSRACLQERSTPPALTVLLVPALLAVCLALTSCTARQLGFPRVEVERGSPDGTRTAFVRNHPELDPPSQSLWLRSPEETIEILRLAPDQDWCDTIVWSDDGSHVAFLIQDARLVVADASEGRVVVDCWLVDEPRAYPPQERIVHLSVSNDASEAAFQRCARETQSCQPTERTRLR